MPLNSKQIRHLRGLGHHLSAVVHVGNEGVTDGVAAALDQALTDHELVKVKVLESAPEGRREVARALAGRTGSEEVQVLGRTVLLYRRHPEKPKIKLPGERAASA